MELKRLVNDDEGDKKNKTLALKTEKEKDSDSNEEMTMIIQNSKRFMKRRKENKMSKKIMKNDHPSLLCVFNVERIGIEDQISLRTRKK